MRSSSAVKLLLTFEDEAPLQPMTKGDLYERSKPRMSQIFSVVSAATIPYEDFED
jgi:hypothetical protein